MPIGIQRINAKKSHPNERIVFIKPLKGPDEAVAQDFLERIAAQCLPIMKKHHLSVMTLEEYEPNREFVGRNFNAGEIIQLVLKARGSGRWLPFDYVQMVMMHELAHCKQMNHSKAFWAVRNEYAEQMRHLWGRGYTGDGLWGRGALLTTGEFERNTLRPGDEPMPEHLCGGTYRSSRRGRKRKAKPAVSYREQKERRILKKFGANGVALGADDATKAKLEKGRRVAAAPRVAGSLRGRELRAAAALARFEQQKVPEKKAEDPEEDDEETASGSQTESGSDGDEDGSSTAGDGTVRIEGTKMVDGKGHTFVRVCGDESPDDEDAAGEMADLRNYMLRKENPDNIKPKDSPTPSDSPVVTRVEDMDLRKEGKPSADVKAEDLRPKTDNTPSAQTRSEGGSTAKSSGIDNTEQQGIICAVCSFANDGTSITCGMCSNVLDPGKAPGSWRCQSSTCQGAPSSTQEIVVCAEFAGGKSLNGDRALRASLIAAAHDPFGWLDWTLSLAVRVSACHGA